MIGGERNPRVPGKRVELRRPDPTWAEVFEREARAILAALSPLGPIRVEHIGSTAVAGIRAKPVIDIMVGVESYARFDDYRGRLESLHYDYDERALHDDPDRHVFRKGPQPPQLRTHHLHFTLWGGRYWVRILAFRDYLRAHASVAEEYERLKAELADRFAEDSRSYTRGKGAFVRRVQAIAMERTSQR